jgi:hypothetical protein
MAIWAFSWVTGPECGFRTRGRNGNLASDGKHVEGMRGGN